MTSACIRELEFLLRWTIHMMFWCYYGIFLNGHGHVFFSILRDLFLNTTIKGNLYIVAVSVVYVLTPSFKFLLLVMSAPRHDLFQANLYLLNSLDIVNACIFIYNDIRENLEGDYHFDSDLSILIFFEDYIWFFKLFMPQMILIVL